MLLATQIAEFLGQYGILGLLVLLVVAFIYVIKNFETIFKSWTLFRTSRIATIKQALEASAENSALQQCYKTELESEHFRLVCGIASTPEYRKSILDLLSKSEGKLTLSMIKRSQEFRDRDSSKFSVKLATRHYVWKLVNLVLGLVNFLIALLSLSFLVGWIISGIPGADYQLFGSYFLFFLFGAYFFIREVWAYDNATRVKQVLDSLYFSHSKAC